MIWRRRCLQQSKTANAGLSVRVLSSVPTRRLHGSPTLADSSASPSQSQLRGDYYADLLAKPMPRASEATSSPLPIFVQSGDATKEERARKLFGSVRGSGYQRRSSDTPDETWRTVNGVPIPPRPQEPDNCCMSGCVNCVWDDYRVDVEQWARRLREARAKGAGRAATTTPKMRLSRPEVADASVSMDDDGGGSDTLWTMSSGQDEGDDLFSEIPVGIREFMATEKRIKARKAEQKQGSL
ncbi:hypothetical protein DV736_g3465, partial [Chaetothyriales sp. CBS 134916]